MFITDVFQPFGRTCFAFFHDGYVGHGRFRPRPMPMFFAGFKPNHIPRLDFFDRAAPALHPPPARRHNQSLTQRVGVLGGPRPRLKRHISAQVVRRSRRVKQRIHPDIARKILSRGNSGRLRAISFDLHSVNASVYQG